MATVVNGCLFIATSQLTVQRDKLMRTVNNYVTTTDNDGLLFISVHLWTGNDVKRHIYNTRNHLSQPAVVSVVVATIKIIITMII